MMHCTLRALAAQFLLLSCLSVRNLATAQSTSRTATTITVTSTTILATAYVIITSNGSSYSTLTTEMEPTVIGATGGSTIVVETSAPTVNPAPAAPPPSASTGSMSYSGQAFQAAVLNSTNFYRAQHQAQPLVWDMPLAEYALGYAQKCVFAHSGGSYGENLAENFATPTLAIDAWADEEKDYNYEKQNFAETSGHFTQLVWKGTTSVGCGAVQCNNNGPNGANGWFLVCEYGPRGNVVGAFGENVGKTGQGKDGEPGFGGAERLGGGYGWIGALVATILVAGLCM